MILIIEPQCRGFAHEQFNAAFLYGYSLAYPDERIVFWGEKEHIACVQTVIRSAGLALNHIEFNEIDIPESSELSDPKVILRYYQIFRKILQFASESSCNRIAFLSIYSFNLLPLKWLIRKEYKDNFRFHMMMHGTLEFIKRSNIKFPFVLFFLGILKGLRKHLKLPLKESRLKPTNEYLYEKLFKFSLQLFGNKDITYYVFREDSRRRVKDYLPTMQKSFASIDLPYIYNDVLLHRAKSLSNKKVFATIGRGDIFSVQKVVKKLTAVNEISENDFEVRMIGRAKINQNDFAPIKYVSDGRVLSRADMEKQLDDVHYLLYFYDPDEWELTTSGSFFDAVAYCKPVIFLKNACFDYYYRNYKFGYRCENTDEVARIMQRITADDDGKYSEFCSELERLQRDISISNTYPKLRFV